MFRFPSTQAHLMNVCAVAAWISFCATIIYSLEQQASSCIGMTVPLLEKWLIYLPQSHFTANGGASMSCRTLVLDKRIKSIFIVMFFMFLLCKWWNKLQLSSYFAYTLNYSMNSHTRHPHTANCNVKVLFVNITDQIRWEESLKSIYINYGQKAI